jgi:hypothetical protein
MHQEPVTIHRFLANEILYNYKSKTLAALIRLAVLENGNGHRWTRLNVAPSDIVSSRYGQNIFSGFRDGEFEEQTVCNSFWDYTLNLFAQVSNVLHNRNRNSIQIRTFGDVTPCSLVRVDRRLRGVCCLHHQGSEWVNLISNYLNVGDTYEQNVNRVQCILFIFIWTEIIQLTAL